MPSLLRPRFLLYLIIVAAVLCSLQVVVTRSLTIDRVGEVDIALDLDAVARLCRQVGYSREDFLREAAQAGATSLGIRGLTIAGLVDDGDALLLSGTELRDMIRLGDFVWPHRVRADRSYLVMADPVAARSLEPAFERTLSRTWGGRMSFEDVTAFEIAATVDELADLQLGFPPEAVDIADRYSLQPVFIAGPVPRRLPQAILGLIGEAGVSGSKLLLRGWTVPGYPQFAAQAGQELATAGLQLGVFENRPQLGIEQLAAGSDYTGFRVRLISPQDRPGSIALAARDRQIRMFYIEPTLGSRTASEAVPAWLSLVSRAHRELEGAGFQTGNAAGFPVHRVGRSALILAGLGAGAAAWIALSMAAGLSARLDWMGVMAAAAGGAVSASGYVGREAVALTAAIAFASLALSVVSIRRPRPVTGVLIALGLALAGGMVIVCLLGDVAWALTVRQFRGVKPAYFLPPAIAAVLAITRIAEARQVRVSALMRGWLFRPIAAGYIVLTVLALAALFLYVGRSGHSLGLPVPGLEQLLRTALEDTLGARPRTKEFLAGYPALVFALGLWAKRSEWAWIWALLASTAPVSVINSFSHLHTPVWQSVVRSLFGAAVGLAVGMAAWELYIRLAAAVKGWAEHDEPVA